MRHLLTILGLFVVCVINAQIQDLNLGSSANDGTGTTLRAGGTIINANFDYLDSRIDTASDEIDALPTSLETHLLVDTMSASVLNAGVGNTGDSAIFESGIFLGGWRQYQDSVNFERLDVKIWGEVGDSIGVTGYWNKYSSDSTGTVTVIDFDIGIPTGRTSYRRVINSFTVETVGPGEIYFKVDAIHGNRPKMIRGTLGYTEKR